MVTFVPYTSKILAMALQDLTGITTRTRFEQHCDVKASRRKENSHHLCNSSDFFDNHNRINVLVSKLINITTGVIASDDINIDSTVDVRTKTVSGSDHTKNLVRYSLKETTKQKRLE